MPVPRDRLKAEVHSLNQYPQPGDFWFSDTDKVPRQIYHRGERERQREYIELAMFPFCFQSIITVYSASYITHRLSPILDSVGILFHKSGLQKETHPNTTGDPSVYKAPLPAAWHLISIQQLASLPTVSVLPQPPRRYGPTQLLLQVSWPGPHSWRL